MGANSVKEAMTFQQELQVLFSQGGFLLLKWKSSNLKVLEHVHSHLLDSHLLDSHLSHNLFDSMISQRPLVLNAVHVWTAPRLSLAEFSRSAVLTKHVVVPEIAKIFDVLSLFLLLLSYRLRFFSKKPGNRSLAGMILFLQRSKNRGKRREMNSLCSQKR